MIESFASVKQRKERGLSVEDVSNRLEQHKSKYTDIIVIGLIDGKEVEVVVSSDNDALMIGLMEVAKSWLIDDM